MLRRNSIWRRRFLFILRPLAFLAFVVVLYLLLEEPLEFFKSRAPKLPGQAAKNVEEQLEMEQAQGERESSIDSDAGNQIKPTISDLDKDQPATDDEPFQNMHNVHIFYYPWYGNPQFDNAWYHWNHEYIPHWDQKVKDQWTWGVKHRPPGDIGANFYPQLGCYSSRDPAVIAQHMAWIRSARIGTLVVSWYPENRGDKNGKPWDDLMPTILDAAAEKGLKVAFHLEPYENRTAETIREDISYVLKKYGIHKAFYFYTFKGVKKPVFYVYDSYLVPDSQWRRLLRTGHEISIRHTSLDAYFLGLLVKVEDKTNLLSNGFDGFYTYFAVDGFSFGSTWKNWPHLTAYGRKTKAISSVSIGPGYIDERVRPWNRVNTKSRDGGNYYREAFEKVVESNPNIISITSFNEWHEGTQIEPAVPKSIDNLTYDDYKPNNPEYYLQMTRNFVDKKIASKLWGKEISGKER